jgi:hypothetical protein
MIEKEYDELSSFIQMGMIMKEYISWEKLTLILDW